MTDLHRLDRLDGLDRAFGNTVRHVIGYCADRGTMLRVTYGPRSPHEQARLWRRSRTSAEVRQAVADMRRLGAPWLAEVLDGVGPQPSGPWATNALPGRSWHQHGLAVDVAWMVDGPDADTLIDDVSWDTSPGSGYRVWREVATAHGLYRGPERDWAHIQGRATSAPTMLWPELDAAMHKRWAT